MYVALTVTEWIRGTHVPYRYPSRLPTNRQDMHSILLSSRHMWATHIHRPLQGAAAKQVVKPGLFTSRDPSVISLSPSPSLIDRASASGVSSLFCTLKKPASFHFSPQNHNSKFVGEASILDKSWLLKSLVSIWELNKDNDKESLYLIVFSLENIQDHWYETE